MGWSGEERNMTEDRSVAEQEDYCFACGEANPIGLHFGVLRAGWMLHDDEGSSTGIPELYWCGTWRHYYDDAG